VKLRIKNTLLLPFHNSSYWKQKKKTRRLPPPFQDNIKTSKTQHFTSPTDTKLFDDDNKFLQNMDVFLGLRNNTTI
jgi:predicted transcriptional regulator